MLEKFYVYLIANFNNKKIITYVGWTNNLKKRLQLHNSGKGAKFTRGRKWILIFKKKLVSKKKAMQFEYKLKKNRKARKVIINKFISTTQNCL
ncbi:MAG: GIY-YIG nuclease family protein [Proteobacteria bacterium]|nr:GIY-YIG nuclease family protein [Candidatus Fonsibacter sp. PEL3]